MGIQHTGFVPARVLTMWKKTSNSVRPEASFSRDSPSNNTRSRLGPPPTHWDKGGRQTYTQDSDVNGLMVEVREKGLGPHL